MRTLPAHVVGILPTAPGYSAFQVRPHLGDLVTASASVPTPFGEIEVSWTIEGSKRSGTFHVPPNTTAAISLPSRSFTDVEVHESGTLVWANGSFVPGAVGVSAGTKEPGFHTFDVGAGTYRFVLSGSSLSGVQPLSQTPLRR